MDQTMCDKKTQITNLVQSLFDEYLINEEKFKQYKCENDLELRSNIDTIRCLNNDNKQLTEQILSLEKNLTDKNKQLHEYETMIRSLEDKINDLMNEKEQENKFNIVRVQANTILEKENEIERLLALLDKNKEKDQKVDTKILNVIQDIDDSINTEEVEISVIKNKTNEPLNKEVTDDDSYYEDDDYEIITYRKKEYWIKTGEDPQYVYEVINDDELGDKIGVYKKDTKGKLKVFLDK